MPKNHTTTNNAPPSGAPRATNQRAGLGQIMDLIRFCNRKPYSRPCVVFGDVGGQFVKV